MNGQPCGDGGGAEEVQLQIVDGESETPEQQGPKGVAPSHLVAGVA